MISLNDLRACQTVVDDLDWPFDFSLQRVDAESGWIILKPAVPFTILAGEGTGGVFLAYGGEDHEKLPILFASSEGEAGKVGSNLTEFLAMLLAIPYWRDLLKFSGGGKLDEMRKTAVFMEREYAEDHADLAEAHARLSRALTIPIICDPIKVLHDNVHSSDCTVVADDGCEYRSLFNTFVSENNPNWD